MNETMELAKFISEVHYSDLSTDVIEKTKGLLLDQLGCQLSFSQMPWCRITHDYIKDCKSECRDSSVMFYGTKTSPENAAFANAVFGHGFEMDDTEFHSITHPGSVIIPAALAVAEADHVGGKDFITAVVLGYEAMIRIGSAGISMMQRGYQPTAAVGPFGATAAAGKIKRLDVSLILNALGIAGSVTSGISEYSETGGSVKRLHAAFAAQSGVRSTLLAQRGFTGPPTVLEGRKGFLQAYANDFSLGDITKDLGLEYRIMWTGNKPYCCCAGQHSAIDATAGILQDHDFDADAIDEIIVGCASREVKSIGSIIEPHDMTSAQFSGSFGVALRISKGSNGYEAYTEESIHDPQIHNLARKVKFVADRELDEANITGAPAKVTIKLHNGTALQNRVNYAKGTVKNPMTQDEITEKFRGLVSMVLSEKQSDLIIQKINCLESSDDISELIELLVQRE